MNKAIGIMKKNGGPMGNKDIRQYMGLSVMDMSDVLSTLFDKQLITKRRIPGVKMVYEIKKHSVANYGFRDDIIQLFFSITQVRPVEDKYQ